jgi:hypothetical protein
MRLSSSRIFKNKGKDLKETVGFLYMDALKTDDFVSAYDNDKNQYLENKTNKIIRQEIIASLGKQNESLVTKLSGYRFVDEVDQLHVGKFTRWISRYESNAKLAVGGFVTNVDYTDNGILLTVKTWQNQVMKVVFDQCLLYQKLSPNEKLVLLAADYLNSIE